MDVSGASSINPALKAGPANDFTLRPNQHIAAEVIRVSGEQIVLSLQGVPIVARLTSPEQMNTLGEHQLRQFIVRDVSEQVVTLQLINTPLNANQSSAPEAGNLVASILYQLGIQETPENDLLAQAAIHQKLLVTPEMLSELREGLAGFTGWGIQEAQTAVALKALGLPVSAGFISLFGNSQAVIRESVVRLLAELQSQIQGDSYSSLKSISSALDTLSLLILNLGSPPAELRNKLQQAIALLGRPVEHDLAWLSNGKETETRLLQKSLLALAELRGRLEASNQEPLVKAIDQFLEAAHWQQLVNISPREEPRNGQWIRLDLPVQFNQEKPTAKGGDLRTARIKIAYNGDPGECAVNPRFTHIIVQVDLPQTEALEVDLSVASQHVGVEVTGTSQTLCDLAQSELDSLATGLASIGYTLDRSLFTVANQIGPDLDLDPGPIDDTLLREVDVSI